MALCHKRLGDGQANPGTGAREEDLFHRSIVTLLFMRGQFLLLCTPMISRPDRAEHEKERGS